MIVTTDASSLYARQAAAFDSAVADTLAAHRAAAPRRSGEYVDSLRRTRSGRGNVASIGSPLARARAMRFGANVGPRPGPHHGAVYEFDDGERFVDAMTARLRR